jgi:hypothetical protein
MASFYRVVKAGDINRDETHNVAIVAYGRPDIDGGTTGFVVRMLTNWTRFRAMFMWGDELEQEITKRLAEITSLEQLDDVIKRMGPYTPFIFTEPRGSLDSPEATVESMAKYFLYDSAADPKREPGVVLTLKEAKAARAYFAGDHFEGSDIETAWTKFNRVIEAAREVEAREDK